MIPLALNVLALIMVLGMCWMAMMWLSGRNHGFGASSHRGAMSDASIDSIDETGACTACEGVGATNERGKLQPCAACRGTGVT